MKSTIIILLLSTQVVLSNMAQDTLRFCDPWDAIYPGSNCDHYYGVNFDDSEKMPVFIDTSAKDNVWQIGATSKFGLIDSQLGKSLITDTLNSYPESNYSTFEIICTGWYQQGFVLGFYHMYDTDQGKDGCRIEIYNGWEDAWQEFKDFPNEIYFDGYQETDTVASLDNKPGFSGKIDYWDFASFSISNYPNELDTIRIRFIFASDSVHSNHGGWIIDDFQIMGMYEGIEESGYDQISSKVYPNPASSGLFIEFDNLESKEYQFSIYDNLGRLIVAEDDISSNQTELDVSEYQPGIYYYKLLNEVDRVGSWGSFIIK